MIKVSKEEQQKLKKRNILAGIFHGVSVLAVLAFSNDFSLPVTASYLTGPPGSDFSQAVTLFNIPTGLAVAAFLALSSFFHFLVVSSKFFPQYIDGLKNNINRFRWIEYSLSSTLMIVLIAQITGISNYGALLAITGVNASMILFGWLQEKYVAPGEKDLLPFIFGSITGIVPWLVVFVSVWAPKSPVEASPPGFVYGIIISIFAFFNSFAYVQYKQYQANGKWKNYLRGEYAYITLSFTAKAALAVQIFANTLI